MAELRVQNKLQLGIAWHWVKFSFATFREKPINFISFGLAFMLFSILPFIGSFFSVLIIARIYLSADKVGKNTPFGLGLNFAELFKQRNLVRFAIFNMFFDLLAMSIFQELLTFLHLNANKTEIILDQRVLLILIGFSIFRSIFFGISLALITFNPELKLFNALLLNWKFILRHWAVIALALFLLLPFLLVPLYIASLITLAVNSNILFILAAIVLLIVLLLFLLVTTIFSYKLYQDGIICYEVIA